MTSNAELQHLDLIDLLNERHHLVQGISEKEWNEKNSIYISHSEWYILAKIYNKQPAISSITKNVDISRQAIHKLIKNLSAKGLTEVHKMEDNKKEKYIELTAFGKKCYEEKAKHKAQLENEITEKLGEEQVKVLKDILRMDWGVSDAANGK